MIEDNNGDIIMFLSLLEAKLLFAECVIFWCHEYEKNGSKTCLFTILMLIYIKLTYSQY